MAIKSTPASVESELQAKLNGFKDRATSIKDGYRETRRKILDDPMLSDLAKQTKLDALKVDTRAKLNTLKGEQESYISGLRSKLERELAGNQPMDASSVLLRRDAADRARKITNEAEALSVLADASRGGDDTLADAVGYRARHAGWVNAMDAYKEARPGAADSAVALAFVEGLATDPGFNLASQIAFSDPSESTVG